MSDSRISRGEFLGYAKRCCSRCHRQNLGQGTAQCAVILVTGVLLAANWMNANWEMLNVLSDREKNLLDRSRGSRRKAVFSSDESNPATGEPFEGKKAKLASEMLGDGGGWQNAGPVAVEN